MIVIHREPMKAWLDRAASTAARSQKPRKATADTQ
jgi:hypothetical protein